MLATAEEAVNLIDAGTGNTIKSLPIKDRHAMAVAISPDGKLLAGGLYVFGNEVQGEVTLWHLPSGHRHVSLTGLHSAPESIGFSPDGKILAAGSCGPILERKGVRWVSGEIRLWNSQTGKLVRKIPGEFGNSSLAFSPDGKSLLNCNDAVVALTETFTGLRRLVLVKQDGRFLPPEQ